MWEIIDTRTLVVLAALFLAMCTGVVGLLMISRRPLPAATEWGLGLMAYVISSMASLIRRSTIDDPFLYIGVFLGILTVTLLWAGGRRWQGRPASRLLIWGVPLLSAAGVAASEVAGFPWPVFLMITPLVTGILLGLTAWELWGIAGLRQVRWMLSGCALIQIGRLALYLPWVPIEFTVVVTASYLVLAVQVLLTGLALYRAVVRAAEPECQ